MGPLVSVVMPVHNAAGFLREAVDSVLAQTLSDFEFVIVDDGSTDGSAEILRSYTDARVRVITQANGGLVAALNRGIALSQGEFIARMDADDRCEPDRLQEQSRFLRQHPEVALVGGSIATMDEGGNALAAFVPFPAAHEQIWRDIGRRPWVFCHPAVMFRRQAALDVGLYDPAFAHAEDTEFFARLMTRYRAANVPDRLLHYRLRRGAVSFTKTAHGRANAELVATIIDRWRPGERFAATADERRATDLRISAAMQHAPTAAQTEAAYHCRLGRELLRDRRWNRARRHYLTAVRCDPRNRLGYMGLACGVLHVGGAPYRFTGSVG